VVPVSTIELTPEGGRGGRVGIKRGCEGRLGERVGRKRGYDEWMRMGVGIQ
jgi:hypothetical protein